MENDKIRRSLTIPKELDLRISQLEKKYNYTVKNDLYVELIENGIIKLEEDDSINTNILKLLDKVNKMIKVLENNVRRF